MSLTLFGVGKGRTGVLVAEALGSLKVHQWVGDCGWCPGTRARQRGGAGNAASVVRDRTRRQHTMMTMS